MFSILIVVPTLNSYTQLKRLVASLQEQTSDRWRVIFIDGKSHPVHIEWLNNLSLADNRFKWETQREKESGIYGAMNQGYTHCLSNNEWVLFWGSDDFAASPFTIEDILYRLENSSSLGRQIDLYVFSATYYTQKTINDSNAFNLSRSSSFVWRNTMLRSLFWGSTPPHQATLFPPIKQSRISKFDSNYRIAADLEYFIRLAKQSNLNVIVDYMVIVFMGSAGVSAKENRRRLSEVFLIYKSAFGWCCLFPFVLRYIQRAKSIITVNGRI